MNFTCPPYYICKSHEEVIDLKDQYANKLRDEFEYLLDGMVIHTNDLEKWYSFGYNEHHPYGSVAFKFEAPCKETGVKEIIDQVGNSGHITPVCVFTEKVELAGADVEKASLHNYGNINDLGIDIGARIIVSRRNDVIPFVEEVIQSTSSIYKTPSNCPVCGAKTQFYGEFLICPNTSGCPAQIAGRIINWINTLNVLEWGKALINRLVESKKDVVILGDIVIAPAVAAAQAEVAGHSTEDEIFILATHGLLHILGYDHADPDEEKVMFALQSKIVKEWSEQ